MTRWASYLASPLARGLLRRTAAFTLLAFMLLAGGELWLERAGERAEVHSGAVRATQQALPSIEHALWTYDQSALRLAAQSLLRENAIASVRIDSPEESMRLFIGEPDRQADAGVQHWSRVLHAPGGNEAIGRIEIGESFRQVDADTWARATGHLPWELLKVLCIVVGLMLFTHGQVVARLSALARQVKGLDAQGAPARVVDIGAQRYGNDEIGELAAALNEFLSQREAGRAHELLRERAEASSSAKSELISRISHELRTPLNAIIGFAHVLQDDPVVAADPSRAERVGLIGKAGRHLASLITDLIDYSRFERGAERIHLQPVPLEALCRDATALVASDALASGVHLAQELAPEAAWVVADPIRLEQVLLNLLSNAIKYNREGGRVELSTRRAADGRVELRVADDGLGMTREQLAALFQPFNRLGRESSGRPGTGIGLVISRRLVELMGGELDVASRELHGSVFTVRLQGAEAGGAPPPDHAAAAGARAVAASAGTIVYVEDDAVNIEVMRAVLAARPAVTLRVATSLREAWQILQHETPRLVLLDLHLPDGDGTQLLKSLRADPERAELPVLVVSADAQEQGMAAALAAGADGYVAKPLDIAAFLARIDALLGATELRPG